MRVVAGVDVERLELEVGCGDNGEPRVVENKREKRGSDKTSGGGVIVAVGEDVEYMRPRQWQSRRRLFRW